MFEYKIKIDKKIITILGPHLYGDTASIIAELISNSYDADAENCWVTILTGDTPGIIIEDDGIGMTPADINDHFLEIGINRRDTDSVTEKGRKVFGRKGIGKLAAFSLANTIKVYSLKGNEKAGCILDYEQITIHNKEPETIPDDLITFSANRLSEKGTGTRIELTNIKKNIENIFYYLVNRVMRNFNVDFDQFKIHIALNSESAKTVKYSDIDYFSKMDTIVTIGDEFESKKELVQTNKITDNKYKNIVSYSELTELVQGTRTKLIELPKEINAVAKSGELKPIMFQVSGWVGTVLNKESLLGLVYSPTEFSDEEGQETISVNDNRITIFSRGRIGEYDILPKVQTTGASDAYVIGEIHAEIFEDDEFIDMAISNRRGYEETDQRYQTLISFLKPLVRYIINRRNALARQRTKDEKEIQEQQEAKEIQDSILANTKTMAILENKLDSEEQRIIGDELIQYARAKRLAKNTKRILISHNADNKEYGLFLVKIFETLGLVPEEEIIFTSLDRTGVPQGKDIYEYLKDCFRDDLHVIFLFSKHFYDSNVCIAETGAAWATNRYYTIITLDIDFGDIDKPINNAIQGFDLSDPTNFSHNSFIQFIKAVLSDIGTEPPSDADIDQVITHVLSEFDTQLNLSAFIPQRKFQGHPVCDKNGCGLPMNFTMDASGPCYVCPSGSCGNRISAKIQ